MSSVTSTKDLQSRIAAGVNESWKSLQLKRRDWGFMRTRYQGFITTIGKESYTPTEVGLTDLGTYANQGIWLNNRPLTEIRAEDLPYIDNTEEGEPSWYSIDTNGNTLYLQLPDDNYTMDIYYRRSVQDLFSGTTPNDNVPLLPEDYHDMLVFAGLSKFGTFIESGALKAEWEANYQKMLGDLMREYLPSKRIKTRSII